MTTLSIVIPVYRGAKTIPDLVEALAATLPQLATAYEVIIVEDDGGDESWEVIQQLSEQYAWVRGFKLMRNFGQHAALLCGIRAAQYEVIVTMDDDMQHPPAEISKLLAKLDEGYDVVYGAPQDKQHAQGRNLGSIVIRRTLSLVMGVDAARHASAFRAFRTYIRDAFADYTSPYVAIDVLLTWGTNKFGVVQVDHQPRTVGTSGYSLRKLVNHALTMLTGFSVLPLRLATLLGFTMTAFGFSIFLWIVPLRRVLYGEWSVPGFTFTVTVITVFSGVQMFVIGILGEYLARMHFRIMDKPTYVVRETSQTAPALPIAPMTTSEAGD